MGGLTAGKLFLRVYGLTNRVRLVEEQPFRPILPPLLGSQCECPLVVPIASITRGHCYLTLGGISLSPQEPLWGLSSLSLGPLGPGQPAGLGRDALSVKCYGGVRVANITQLVHYRGLGEHKHLAVTRAHPWPQWWTFIISHGIDPLLDLNLVLLGFGRPLFILLLGRVSARGAVAFIEPNLRPGLPQSVATERAAEGRQCRLPR